MTKKHEDVRKINRAVYNRIVRLFAGKFLHALVRHTGRRSGRKYSAHEAAESKNGFIFIPLTHEAVTDWQLNVKAAGKCSVKIKNKVYVAGSPELVDAATALPAFSNFHQKAFKRFKIEEYLRLKVN